MNAAAARVPVEKKPLPREPLPVDAQGLLGLARTLLDAKDYAGAEDCAHAATLLEPGSLVAWAALGVARARRNRTDAAAKAFLRALEIDAKAIDVWVDLGELSLTCGRYEYAAEALRNACELDRAGKTPAGRRARALIGRTISLLRK